MTEDKDPQQASCDPTEKTLYREPHDDHWGTWQDRLYECGEGPRKWIGIDVSGHVFVKPMKEWHRLAMDERDLETVKKEERRRLLNDPRVKGLFETGNAIEDVLIVPDYLGAHAQHVIQQAIEAFRENLKKFESLLKENEEGKP